VKSEKACGRIMRAIVVTGAIGGAWSLGGQTSRSVLEGVYTNAQAERGRAVYAEQCTDCHGRALEGAYESHTLVGDEFTSNWDGQPLLTLFDRIRITMSGAEPGTITGIIPKPLTREQTADVVAFILWFNKIPAGKEELGTKAEVLEQIRFDTPKNGTKQ
jgi:S-disulfanyl-L-cysteine oxidoreductase SoxD